MIFTETPLPGVWVLETEPVEDERGYFARTFCLEEFSKHGLNPHIEQCSVSYNTRKGTLRGLHWQTAPHEEAKLVRCIRGAVWDVAVDVREGSATYLKWFGIELTGQNNKSIYIPEGCAHGFVTLEDNTMVAYNISTQYYPECARGLHWGDPALTIQWPASPLYVNDKDRNWEYLHV